MRIPIVMLHHISDEKELTSLKPYCISRAKFIELLDFIEESGYTTLDFRDIENKVPSIFASRKIILTFDDCPRHLWDFAIPELRRRRMKAAFYTPTASIGGINEWDVQEGRCRVELMNAAELRELANLGMEVGAHGHHHLRMAELKDDHMVLQELEESKLILEQIIGTPVLSMAFPFGSVPIKHKYLVPTAGFRYGLSIYQPFESRYALRRFIYHDGDTPKTLKQKLSLPYRIYRCASDPFK